MTEQGQKSDKVIQFQCGHCQISLTVDDSLAGVTGPCPSCGENVTAPAPAPEAEAHQKLPVRPREIRQRENVQIDGRNRSGSAARRSNGDRRRRSISPETGVSEAHRERAEVAAVAKMLIAGLVVLAIVLAVAYWLNHRFNA